MPKSAVALLLVLPLAVGACDALTGPGDDERLQVVAASPAAGVADASVLSQVLVEFATPLDPMSAGEAMALYAEDRAVSGTLSRDEAHSLLFAPSSPLDFGTTYSVRISGSLADSGGATLGEEYSYTFTTQGAAPPTPDAESLRAFVTVLAHDSLRGRGSGTNDEARAAAYLASLFADFGLDPLEGAFIQPFVATAWDGSTVSSRNVLAVVPGSGSLAQEWLVLGGHYDHVGIRTVGDGTQQIHNGADDNASGTATVMELARLYAAYAEADGMADQGRRSVLFAAWGAEEKGLLGSCAFTRTDLVPMGSVMATMNFDMVGRLRGNSVDARGAESSARWGFLLQDANRPVLALATATPACQNCTDHACFRSAGVPYMWFFTGTHSDYHAPGDDAPLINYEGTARIAELAFRMLTRLAVMPQGLSFTP